MPKPAKGSRNKTVTIDTVMIIGMEVRTFPVGQEAVVVTYSSGHMQGADFLPVERHQFIIQQEEFNALAAHVPDGVKTLWEELEALIYAEIDKDSGV